MNERFQLMTQVTLTLPQDWDGRRTVHVAHACGDAQMTVEAGAAELLAEAVTMQVRFDWELALTLDESGLHILGVAMRPPA